MAQCLSADVGEDESSFPQFDISVSTEAARQAEPSLDHRLSRSACQAAPPTGP